MLQKTLIEIGADHIPTLLVYNKTDLLQPEQLVSRNRLEFADNSTATDGLTSEVFVSVETNHNMQNSTSYWRL